jgi:hypothetical protein
MLNKHENDWCGEYAEKPVEMVKLPVYDIMTDTTIPAPKRKYTRRKDVQTVA